MGKKVLIVLDGVDQLVQLLAMPKVLCLGPGSRIIITTQDQKLLKAIHIKHIYSVDFPPADEALQIFCMHASCHDSPDDGFDKLAKKVTRLAGNLPLGLRVMGSYFRGMSKEDWKGELPRLRIRLDGEIGSILNFTYDALDDEDKDLFLHIACFFNDEGVDHTFEDALRHKFSNVQRGLQVLFQRSLISKEKTQSMHNLLVMLGREIVRNQSINEPKKRQFLVDDREICEVLAEHTGSERLIGINLEVYGNVEELNISERCFETISNLQFLRVYHKKLHLPQGLYYLPPKLRILHWDYYPMKCLPSKFNPKFLVKIILKHSKLEKLWERIQPLINLRVMDLGHSLNLKELPCLSTATNLLVLNLYECSSLIELSFSIGNATNIQSLNLIDCSSLVELPSSIGNLISLQGFYIHGCSSLVELPSSIGNLISLKKLDLSGCSSLVELPSSIGSLINLQELDLCSCSSLVELPSSIGNLINLKEFLFHECSSLVELPSSIGNLINLQILYLSRCSSLVELPSSIGNLVNLQKLDLSKCSSLVELPSSIGNLINLQKLYMAKCSSLMKLPSSIGEIINLERLYLNGCSSLVELPLSIGNLINIWELWLHECSSLVKLPSSIGDIIKLEELDLRGCSSLVELPSSIGNLCMLRELSLRECSKVEVLPFNITLDSLEELDVTGCSQLTSFPEISTNIERLILCGTLIKEVPSSIKSWSRLHVFRITYFKDLEEFPHGLDIITDLELNDTEMEEVPAWVNGMSRLRLLVLNRCTKLVSLPQFPSSLKFLNVENCESLETLACSFPNPEVRLIFVDCWKLNERGRDIIIQTSTSEFAILPGREVPAFFTYRAITGGSVAVKLNQRCLPTSLRFKACILLIRKSEKTTYEDCWSSVRLTIVDKQSGHEYNLRSPTLSPLLTEHLYTFEGEVNNVESRDLFFMFEVRNYKWGISECGIRPLLEEDTMT